MVDPIRARLDEYDHGDLRDALRAVLDLHHRVDAMVNAPYRLNHGAGYSACQMCVDHGDPSWPCATVAAIAEHLGVTDAGPDE